MIYDTNISSRDWMRRVEEAAVLAAAWQVGLLEPLAAGCSEDDLAQICGLDPSALGLVLHGLHAMGAVEQSHGRYQLVASLRDASPVGLAPHTRVWAGLPGFLRTGRSTVSFGSSAVDRGATYGDVVGALGDWFEDEAAELAAALPAVGSILDLGAGSAVWSLAMAARAPETRVVGVDLPEVIPAMTARATALGLSIETLAGDLRTVALPVVDRVVLGNLLHLEQGPAAREILRCAGEALPPGGELVIVDVIPDGRAEGAVEAALYAIQLALRVPTGAVHTQQTLTGWLTAEGFSAPRRIALGPGQALAALVATKMG